MGSYDLATELMSIEDKKDFLDEIGRDELIKVFDSWTPKSAISRYHRHANNSQLLDQKMSLTVTRDDRKLFESHLKELKDAGEEFSMSQFIRNKATSTPDIVGWKNIAVESLIEISDTLKNKKDINQRINSLSEMIDNEKDSSILDTYYDEQKELKNKLSKLKGVSTKRTQRLSGRVTFDESELIKWRAARLCLSTSDYLRMMIFDLEPSSDADKHMSLAARQRFYIAIGDVAKNGWGEVAKVNSCSQCETLADKINRLELENAQLRSLL